MSTRSSAKSRRSGGSGGSRSNSTLNETEVKEIELLKLQIEERIEEEASREREKDREEKKRRAFRRIELEYEINKAKSLQSNNSGSGSSIASTVIDNTIGLENRSNPNMSDKKSRTQDWINNSMPGGQGRSGFLIVDECDGTPDTCTINPPREPKTSTPDIFPHQSKTEEHTSMNKVSLIPKPTDTPMRPRGEQVNDFNNDPGNGTHRNNSHKRSFAIDEDVVTMMNTTLKLQQEYNRSTALPVMKLRRFDGDVTTFSAFSQSFRHHVEENTNDPSRRLSMLINHLDGPPRELIEGCLELQSDIGYQLAWSRLNEEYSHTHDVIDSYLKKLWAWKTIEANDYEELQRYHSYLFKIECALGADIGRLEFKEVLNRIVSKLPNYLKNKWADKAIDPSTGTPRGFSYLVQFVKDEARKAKDRSEIYEIDKRTIATKDVKSEKATSVAKKTLALHATSTVKDLTCVYCERKGHELNTCFKFEKLKIDDRWEFVTKKALCFRCLIKYHHHLECEEKSVCKYCGAESHHSLLHNARRDYRLGKPDERSDTSDGKHDGESDVPIASDKKSSVKTEGKIEDAKGESTSHTTLSVSTLTSPEPDGSTMLKILPVKVSEEMFTYAFIDGGAVPTLISQSLAKKLGLKGTPCDQVMRTENGDFHCYEVVSLSITGVDGGEDILLENAYVTKRLSVTTEHLMPLRWVGKWEHLRDIQLARLPDSHQDVEIIVGLNSILNRHILEQRHGSENEPSAYRTRLGWVAFGPTGPKGKRSVAPVHRITCAQNLDEILQESHKRDFWESEIHCRMEESLEDQFFVKKMEDMKQEAGIGSHYVVKLPYRYEKSLPNNKDCAMNRMKSLKKKFENDEGYKLAYSELIEGYIAKGYAEAVPMNSIERNDGRLWYMPHFAVVHPAKLKLRVVFDLKAKFKGVSLNEFLIQGPDLTNTLNGVILRFRNGLFALTADIAEMFHQVKVDEDERDVFRFLWWPGGNTEHAPIEYRMCVLPFGARSSPACANYALRQTALDYGDKFSERAASAVLNNFYVDNLLVAVDTEEEGESLAKDLIELCAAGGWRLCQWTGNSRRILDSIPEGERDKSLASIDLSKDELPVERTLGIHWSMEHDFFTFKVNVKEKPFTRRGVLSVVASIYDPLGLLAPFTLVAKLFLQQLTKRRQGWDAPLDEVDVVTWKAWLLQLTKISDFTLDRSFIPSNFGDVKSRQLHHFADASQDGYGTASYLRIVGMNGEVHCTLIVGRSRVAPIKGGTITRLELAAATVAARMDSKIREELDVDIQRSVFWTDSSAVLKYISNETARFHTFVANRINLIRELTSLDSWRYVNTEHNPADMASRGLEVDRFLCSKSWKNGPEFLTMDEEYWPKLPSDVKLNDLRDDPEVKNAISCATVVQKDPSFMESLASRCGTWPKLLRLVARLKRVAVKKFDRPSTTEITADEMIDAELTIWKLVQDENYSCEKSKLTESKNILKTSSLLKLKPILVDGMLRVGGRLDKSDQPDETKHPLILPSKSGAVELLVRWTHERYAHCGQNHLMSLIREKYWIVHGNSVVRRVIRKCVDCKALCGRPLTQLMASLPVERVTPDTPVFSSTGTDCFGPFLVRRGRSDVKRYGLIFTCLASRAVHLEVLETMETDSFINALRRFLARRGPVKLIWCDNGSNFVGAERVLREALSGLDQDAIVGTLAKQQIEWRFTPPHASHFGGAWERLIRSARRAMKGICEQQVFASDETLTTLMCEVEAVINSRPLTRVTDDPDDLRPLTPSMLLTLKGSIGMITKTCAEDLYARKRWKQVQYLTDLFWRRWTREYLPTLQRLQRWQTLRQDLKEGDIVLTLDEKTPRGTWPMGKVIEVMRNSDGHVRSALVKTEQGLYYRPISKLCMLLENDISD